MNRRTDLASPPPPLERRTTHAARALAFLLVGALAHPAAARVPSATPPGAVPVENPREQATAAFKLGTKLVGETRWGEALASFEQAQALVPHAITLFNVGVCERALGRYTAARRTFEAALAEDTSKRTTLPRQLRQDATAYLGEIERVIARVRVAVTPGRANLAIDGRPVVAADRDRAGTMRLVAGLAPPGRGEPLPAATFELELDPGRHVLTLSRAGFSDAIVARDFTPGRAPELRLALDELPATIEISADEPGALVTVGDRDLGPAPVTLLRPAGSYRVLVEKDGHVPAEALLEVRAGEASTFRATLPPEKPSVLKSWWFWTAAIGVAAGAGVGTYFLTREPPPPVRATVGEGTLGWTVPVP